MDLRDVPIMTMLIGKFSDDGDYAEAYAKLVAEVALGDDYDLTGIEIMTSNKIMGSMLAQWNAEVAIKVAATPGPWNMTKLQEAYSSIHGPVSFIGYYSMWLQRHQDDD